MEELFRFSVIRAASRATNAPVQLAGPPPPDTQPHLMTVAPPLQTQVAQIISDAHGADATAIWPRLEQPAITFLLQNAPNIIADARWTSLATFVEVARQAIVATTEGPPPLDQAFGSLVNADVQSYAQSLADLFVALVIVRRGGPGNIDRIVRARGAWSSAQLLGGKPTIMEVADRIRAAAIVAAGASAFAGLDAGAAAAAFVEAMTKPIAFSNELFAPLSKPVHGVGFRELHVVKQAIRRYELAEIARIENVLAGETRTHTQKHTLSNERDTFFQTESSTEKNDELSATDHVDIKNESQNQVKEDTKVDAGVHASYDGGSFKLQADLTVAYDKSTDETRKFASDVAKDVTKKVSSKVTEKVTQSQTTKLIETFEDTELQSFTAPGANVTGVYQWVEKIYLSQVFSLGRHMLIDLMVPEPGAGLLAIASETPKDLPKPPLPLTYMFVNPVTHVRSEVPLTPDVINFTEPTSPGYYGKWVSRYQVTGIEPLPDPITISKAIAADASDFKGNDLQISDTIKIDDGYKAVSCAVSMTFRARQANEESLVFVSVGTKQYNFSESGAAASGIISTTQVGDANHFASLSGLSDDERALAGEQNTIPISVLSVFVQEASVDIEVHCAPSDALIEKYKVQAYDRIVTAWQKLEADYESKLASAQAAAAAVAPLGADPDTNRMIERTELKRACIAQLSNANEMVRGVSPHVAIAAWPDPAPAATDPTFPPLPEPILPSSPNPNGNDTAGDLGAMVRWFEQAFEWENVAYISYPYFWGRRSTWLSKLGTKHDDPLFQAFLRAGYARVVVPVRLGFESAVLFFLNTGLPWLGGELPPVGDGGQNPLYLDVADEIRALTGGGTVGEIQTPIGEPWEFILPTTNLKLQGGDPLPEWHRIGPDGNESAAYPSDAPAGPWTWKDGAPKLGTP